MSNFIEVTNQKDNRVELINMAYIIKVEDNMITLDMPDGFGFNTVIVCAESYKEILNKLDVPRVMKL